MLLTKLVFTVICVSVLILMTYIMYYLLFDKDFANKTTPLIQGSAAVVSGSFSGVMLNVIYNLITNMWLH